MPFNILSTITTLLLYYFPKISSNDTLQESADVKLNCKMQVMAQTGVLPGLAVTNNMQAAYQTAV